MSAILRRLVETVNAGGQQNALIHRASMSSFGLLHSLEGVIKARVLGDEIMKWESELKAKRLATPPRNIGHLTVHEGGRLPTGHEIESEGYFDKLLRLFIKPRPTAKLVQSDSAADLPN